MLARGMGMRTIMLGENIRVPVRGMGCGLVGYYRVFMYAVGGDYGIASYGALHWIDRFYNG